MNKSDLTRQLAESLHLSMREAGSIVNTIVEAMADALARGESIRSEEQLPDRKSVV